MLARLGALAGLLLALAPVTAQAALTTGGPWVPNVESVAIVNDATWLATTYPAVNLSRTVDAGRTWTPVATFGVKKPPAPQQVFSVAAAGGIAFAIGSTSNEQPTGAFKMATTFGVSTDGGARWSWGKIAPDLAAPTLVANPSNPSQLAIIGYQVQANGVSPGSAQRAVAVSRDRGSSWQDGAPIPSVSSISSEVNGIRVGPDGTLYAPGYRSTDWGSSWQALTYTETGGAAFESRLSVPTPYGSSGLATVAPAGSASTTKGFDLMISSDRGDSWTRLTADLPKSEGTASPPLLAEGPGGQLVYIADAVVRIVRPDGSTAARFDDRPLQQSARSAVVGGTTVIPTTSGVIAVAAGGVENRSTGIAAYTDIDRLFASPTTANLLVASTGSGLYRSSDGGATWTFGGLYTVGAISPVTGTLLAYGDVPETVTDGGGGLVSRLATRIVTSSDGGATWSSGLSPTTGSDPMYVESLAWAGESRALAVLRAGAGCSLGRSDDRFATMAVRALPVGCGRISAGAENPNLLWYVAGGTGAAGSSSTTVWRSTDGGDSWQSISGVVNQIERFGVQATGRLLAGPGANPTLVYWIPGAYTTCASANQGTSFRCAPVPEFTIPTRLSIDETTSKVQRAGIISLAYQPDGALVATLGHDSGLGQLAPESLVVRSFDHGRTWATTGDLTEPVPTAAIDITGAKSARQGGTKRSPTGKRRFALASVGVVRKTLDFSFLSAPALRTAGIKVSRAGGGRVMVPVTCKARHRCRGRITGSLRVGGKTINLAATRFSILGSKAVIVPIGRASRKPFAKTRGTGTIKLQLFYTAPSGKAKRTASTGAVTVR